MNVSERMTSSSALIDFSRPTNSGTIMCGNTTMSRNGNSGSARTLPGVSGGHGLQAVIDPIPFVVPLHPDPDAAAREKCVMGREGNAGHVDPRALAGIGTPCPES